MCLGRDGLFYHVMMVVMPAMVAVPIGRRQGSAGLGGFVARNAPSDTADNSAHRTADNSARHRAADNARAGRTRGCVGLGRSAQKDRRTGERNENFHNGRLLKAKVYGHAVEAELRQGSRQPLEAVRTAAKKPESLRASSLPRVRTPLQRSTPKGRTVSIASPTLASFNPPAR